MGSFLNTTVRPPVEPPDYNVAAPLTFLFQSFNLYKSFGQPFGFICEFSICFQLGKKMKVKQKKTWKRKTQKEQTYQEKQKWEGDINKEESKVMTNPQYPIPVTFFFCVYCPRMPVNNIWTRTKTIYNFSPCFPTFPNFNPYIFNFEGWKTCSLIARIDLPRHNRKFYIPDIFLAI